MVEGVLGLVVSVLAAFLYRDFRREGEPSTFKRIVAFGVGFPWSVIVLATVEPRPDRLTAPDGDTDLLEEIRRERRVLEEEESRGDTERGVRGP